MRVWRHSLEEHQCFISFKPYLLAEDLTDFDLLNSPFKMRHAVRLSPHAKNITPKGFTLWQKKKLVISMSAGSFLTSQEQSVSPQNEPGTVWVNNKQMVWSLSKTNIPLVPAFPPQTENKALCDAWFILYKASHSFGPEELGCFFLWPDSYLPLFSSSPSLFMSSLPLLLLPSLLPLVICCFPAFIRNRPVHWSW